MAAKVVSALWRTPRRAEEEVAWKLLQRRPERILALAVQRMMPKNKIGRHMLGKLRLFVGPQHPHQAQGPIPLDRFSGRPSPVGAVYTPKPVPKTPKPRTASVPAALEGPVVTPPVAVEETVIAVSDAPVEAVSSAPVEAVSDTPIEPTSDASVVAVSDAPRVVAAGRRDPTAGFGRVGVG
ncbi:MAG: uL13 family ribosomal protein [Singulisphaera sp.]